MLTPNLSLTKFLPKFSQENPNRSSEDCKIESKTVATCKVDEMYVCGMEAPKCQARSNAKNRNPQVRQVFAVQFTESVYL